MNVCQTMTMRGPAAHVGGLMVLLAATALSPTAMAEEEPVGVRETRVVLEERGEEPRRELRYDVEPGQTERVEIRVESTLDHETDGEQQQQQRTYSLALVAELTIERVEDQAIHVAGEYLTAELEPAAVAGRCLVRHRAMTRIRASKPETGVG